MDKKHIIKISIQRRTCIFLNINIIHTKFDKKENESMNINNEQYFHTVIYMIKMIKFTSFPINELKKLKNKFN